MELIDKKELIETLKKSPVWTGLDAMARINTMDTTDIVRCKECKYISIYEDETSFYYCALECRPNRQWSVDETDYCSWGERKESE